MDYPLQPRPIPRLPKDSRALALDISCFRSGVETSVFQGGDAVKSNDLQRRNNWFQVQVTLTER